MEDLTGLGRVWKMLKVSKDRPDRAVALKRLLCGLRKFYCKHPFEKSIKVWSHEVKEKYIADKFNYKYMVHIRKCGICEKHFIDEGLEFDE